MKKHWRLLNSFFPKTLERKIYALFFKQEHDTWIAAGKPLPVSHLSKQEELKKLAVKYGTSTLVETGTYMGDMLYSLYPNFSALHSIELSPIFYQRALKRFASYPKIHLLNGDSATAIETVVSKLKEPALFWLDGHYSGGITAKGNKECPVYEELGNIFKSSVKHVIVIDDARLFIGKNDYPMIENLKAFVQKHRPNYMFTLQNDSIQLLPQ